MGERAVPYVVEKGGDRAHGPDLLDHATGEARLFGNRVEKRQEHVHHPYAVRKAGVGGARVHGGRQSQLLQRPEALEVGGVDQLQHDGVLGHVDKVVHGIHYADRLFLPVPFRNATHIVSINIPCRALAHAYGASEPA